MAPCGRFFSIVQYEKNRMITATEAKLAGCLPSTTDEAPAFERSSLKLPTSPHGGPGRLIVVEGLDGAGKTTVTERLAAYLGSQHVDVVRTRIPTDRMRSSEFFELLQRMGRTDLVDPLAFEVDYMVDRIQHGRTFILPHIKVGTWVVSDRYLLSSIGSLLLRLPDLGKVARKALTRDLWFVDLCKYLPAPDIAFLLTAEPGVCVQRVQARPEEADQKLDVSAYADLQALLVDVARENGMHLIDNSGGIEATIANCVDRLRDLLPGDRS